jgi:hypothetical protein
MRLGFRFSVVALLALLAAGPAPAQFVFQREYFGRPGLLHGPRPFVRRHSTPIVVQQVRQEQPRQDDNEGYRDSVPDVARSNIEITVNVAGDPTRNDSIKRAIAECRQWLDGEAPRDGSPLRVAVGATVVLRVPEHPESPMGKADLSDVLDRDEVAWNYPPASLFEVVHEDTTRAVLVLRAKAAGTHTVSAVVLPLPEPLPAPTKKPEPKKAPAKEVKGKKTVSKDSAESAEKEPPRPAPRLTREAIRFHNFTIQVGDAPVVPGTTPPPRPGVDETRPASLDAALEAVKAAYAEERNASGMPLLIFRLTQEKTSTIHAFKRHVDAAKSRTPRTAAAIQQALDIAPAPKEGEPLRSRVARILEQLR